MNDIIYMAWHYLRFHWIKTAVLVASISLILFLPLGLQVIVEQGSDMLTKRAEVTPLLIGAKGSRVDLTLSALYFKQPDLDPIPYREIVQVTESGLAKAIPLNLQYQGGGFRIVGTSMDYIDFRGLELAKGGLFAIIGECILGAKVAQSLSVGLGDHVLSSPAGAFDVAGSFPLKMKIVGILKEKGDVDDQAIFVDLKTAWVISGLAHGHMDMTKPEAESGVLKREGDNVVANASVLSYTEITDENIDSFHFHGNPDEFPVDVVLAVPADLKSGILLRGRYEERTDAVQILVPLEVISGLLETIFSIRDYIIMGSIGVGIATVATTVLVFFLSIRLRQREIKTIRKIGGSRRRLNAILASEILIVVVMSVIIAVVMTAAVSRYGMALAGVFLS